LFNNYLQALANKYFPIFHISSYKIEEF